MGKTKIEGLDVVAIKAGQSDVYAPGHTNWGKVKCDRCNDEFFIGPPRFFLPFGKERDYVKKLEEILSEEHNRKEPHRDAYELGS